MELIYYVSFIAQFLTYASFLSGAKVCHAIYQQKSSARLSPIPFLAGINCSLLWAKYGLLADEAEIVLINAIGFGCSVIYLGIFIAYSRQRRKILLQCLFLAIFLIGLLWIIYNSPDPTFICGSMASMSSLVACAAPLSTIQDVLKTKCVASLPFPIIASSFAVSLSWLIFGYLKDDAFIVFTNVIAVSISGAQLLLFLIYDSEHPYEKLSPSNKKSYDLIKLLNSYEDEFETFDVDELDQRNDPSNSEYQHGNVERRKLTSSGEVDRFNDNDIDTNQDYKQTLARIMGQIYLRREKLSKTGAAGPGAILLLLLLQLS